MNGFVKLLGRLGHASLASLAIFFLTLLLALPLALPVALARMSRAKPLAAITNAYLLIMRGTPLILQLIFVYFAPAWLLGLRIDRFIAVIIAFTLNYAAYFAEIYRGGIASISRGQYEAAPGIGAYKGQTFFKIILPQVVKSILPQWQRGHYPWSRTPPSPRPLPSQKLFRVAQNVAPASSRPCPIFVAGLFTSP